MDGLMHTPYQLGLATLASIIVLFCILLYIFIGMMVVR